MIIIFILYDLFMVCRKNSIFFLFWNTQQIKFYPDYEFSACPAYRRNGKVTRGANLLSAWASQSSWMTRQGSMKGYYAYTFNGGNLSEKLLSQFFPSGLTQVFSVVFTASLQTGGSAAFTIRDQERTYAGFSIHVSRSQKYFEVLQLQNKFRVCFINFQK